MHINRVIKQHVDMPTKGVCLNVCLYADILISTIIRYRLRKYIYYIIYIGYDTIVEREVKYMGMTDKQFEEHLRSEARDLRRIKKEMIESAGKESATLDERLHDIESLIGKLEKN